jgi:lipoprotein-anchoring transpeptidase ErfK/SrfK
VLELQIRLDRAGFSPGEIDGLEGANTRRAVEAWAGARGLANAASDAVLAALRGEDGAPPLVAYRVTPEDVAGPFTSEVPGDLMAQAALPALGYRTPLEALAEQFHASPELLRRLNPGARFDAGDELRVPNTVRNQGSTWSPPRPAGQPTAVALVVSRSRSTVQVRAPDGTVLFHAPVTTGSTHNPLPIGEWKVNGVDRHPKFLNNPDLFWDADPSHAKATIQPGPNNPVGVVWIDVSKPHYGLHGTPEPSRIGHTESHGCVRLTNWDALRLAALVGPGTKVLFEP